MAGHGGFLDHLFGSIFDLDGDGKTDLGEVFVAHQFFKDELSDEDNSWRDYCEDGSEYGIFPEDYETELDYEFALEEAKEAWREDCEDGSEFDIFPEDYETEDEYKEALEEAKAAWREDCEDGSEFDIFPEDYETEDEYKEALEEARGSWKYICGDSDEENFCRGDAVSEDLTKPQPKAAPLDDPAQDSDTEEIKEENYPNKRRYNAAYALAHNFTYISANNERGNKEQECCRFIVHCADQIVAANYLSYDRGFLYAQAIKDHFDLEIALPDEDEKSEMELRQVLQKIARKDIPLSFEIWHWCLEEFLPYARYDDWAAYDMSDAILYESYRLPDNYRQEMVRYMADTPAFTRKFLEASKGYSDGMAELTAMAIRNGDHSLGKTIFQAALAKSGEDWKRINKLAEEMISWCADGEEVETLEYFRDHLLPQIKSIHLPMVQDEIEVWEKEIDEHIESVVEESEKYLYSRKNAWRKTAPDGQRYGLDPCDYSSEQEYLADLQQARYGWREEYRSRDTLGLDVNAFETEEEYRRAYNALVQKQQQEKAQKEQRIAEETLADKTVYTICGVTFYNKNSVYHYLAGKQVPQVGDKVIVPVGQQEAVGTVVSVGQYLRLAAPFPVDKMKKVTGKVLED